MKEIKLSIAENLTEDTLFLIQKKISRMQLLIQLPISKLLSPH